MSLLALPIEVLNQICSHIFDEHVTSLVSRNMYPELFPTKEQIGALYSISVCCKYLTCLKPHLYRYVSTEQCDAYLLLRSFTEDPSLALHVKSFAFGAGRKYDSKKLFTLLRESDTLPASCISALRLEDKTETDIVLLETLLLKCSKLEELHIDLIRFPDDVLFFDSRMWSYPLQQETLQRFPSLKFCNIYTLNERCWESAMIAQTHSLVQASSTSALFLRLQDVLSLEDLDVSFPDLVKLVVNCKGMYIADFKALVNACPNLSSFSYCGELAMGRRRLDRHDQVSVSDIVEAIVPLTNTLTQLRVHIRRAGKDTGHIRHTDILPDLRSFIKLRHLEIDSVSCFDLSDDDQEADQSVDTYTTIPFSDKLPPSLHTLCLLMFDAILPSELMNVPEWKARTSSSLACIKLIYFRYGRSEMEAERDCIAPGTELAKLDATLAEADINLFAEF